MSKLIVLCPRAETELSLGGTAERVRRACDLLCPDNLMPRPAEIVQRHGVTIGIFNPSPALSIAGDSVCLGHVGPTDGLRDGVPHPAGTYALVRASAESVELVTDAVATRTLWYVHDEQWFIASTSQRAVVSLLDSFELEERAVGWMLATGTLGPHAWDRRLRRVPGDTTLALERRTWKIRSETRNVPFRTASRSDVEHEEKLRVALRTSVGAAELDPREWVLPLSGGYDSRGILCLLGRRDGLRTVTWGVASALETPGTDASVARALADAFGLAHTYFETDVGGSSENVETILSRLLICGEGRTDALAAYMDGFAIWKTLFEADVHGVIRGDEGFGWIPVVSEREVRLAVGLPLASDFSNVAPLLEHMGGERPLEPEYMRRDGESLETWRDRLYHEFRIPVVLAALGDLKLPFVELVNPLLGHDVVYAVRELPDALRTNKALFRRIVDRVGPAVPHATSSSIAAPRHILRSAPVVAYLRDELASAHMESVVPRKSRQALIDQLSPRDASLDMRKTPARRSALVRLMPKRLKDRLRGGVAKPKLDVHVLAFRVFVVGKMTELLARRPSTDW